MHGVLLIDPENMQHPFQIQLPGHERGVVIFFMIGISFEACIDGLIDLGVLIN
jgi:hypothetical protein